MADIFISYAREDRETVAKLAAALEGAGYSLWWDRHIATGAEFSADIEREIKAAKAVIVAWSQTAISSHWVKDEATYARDAGKLVPISLDQTEPPMGFRQFQASDLAGWRGAADAAEFVKLKDSIGQKVGARRATPGAARSVPSVRQIPIARRFLIGGAAIILAAAAALAFWQPWKGGPGRVGGAAQPASIAVLPFTDLSEAKDKAYFADGVAEEILNALAQLEGLHVVGRTSSFAFRDKQEDLRAIAQALGVATILEGSVRSAGDHLRVTAQLISAADGFHLWSETYDRPAGDIFAIQDEIAKSVASALSIKLMNADKPLRDEGTSDLEAYHLYLQGHFHFLQRSGDHLPKAIELFKAAIARDPKFARAHAGLAQVYTVLSAYSNAPAVETRAEAERYARIAIDLDPKSAQAHAALGLLATQHSDWRESIEDYTRAMALDPADSTSVLWFAILRIVLGQASQAEQLLAEALTIDPASGINLYWHSRALIALGRMEEAERDAQRAVDLGLLGAYGHLGYFAFRRGDWKAAAEFIRQSWLGFPLSERDLTFSRLCNERVDGDPARLGELVKALDQNFASPDPIVNESVLVALAKVGRVEQALSLFNAMELRDPDEVLFWLWTPEARAARQHPAFKTFARKQNWVEAWRASGWPDVCRPVGADDFKCE